MTPAEIAAKLTPAQVRALRQWEGRREILSACPYIDQEFLMLNGMVKRVRPMLTQITPLGQAVLAVLDEGTK